MAAVDDFATFAVGMSDTYPHAFAITKSDADELSHVTRAIYVGGAGNIKLLTLGGETVTFIGLPVGTTLRIRAKQVFSTDTTATNMVGMY